MTLLQPSADLRARGVLLNVNGAYRTCHTAAGVILRRPGFPTRAPSRLAFDRLGIPARFLPPLPKNPHTRNSSRFFVIREWI